MEFKPKHDKSDASAAVPAPRKPPVVIFVPAQRGPSKIETA